MNFKVNSLQEFLSTYFCTTLRQQPWLNELLNAYNSGCTQLNFAAAVLFHTQCLKTVAFLLFRIWKINFALGLLLCVSTERHNAKKVPWRFSKMILFFPSSSSCSWNFIVSSLEQPSDFKYCWHFFIYSSVHTKSKSIYFFYMILK